jgi:hypothetical protein
MLLQPSFGNLLFLPTIRTLLSVFDCHQATGPTLTDSFLHRDCYVKCWQNAHLAYLSLSAVFLCAYTPLALFTRPLWQELQLSLHVKYEAFDLLVQPVLLCILAAAQVSLQVLSPLAHSVVYTAAVTAYLVLLILKRPLNYERASLWRRLLIAGVVVNGAMGIVERVLDGVQSELLMGISGAFYAALLLTGVTLQLLVSRYSSKLVRAKEDRYDIIKFAFTFGKLAEQHLQAFKNKRFGSMYFDSHEMPIEDAALPSFRRIPRASSETLANRDSQLLASL